MDEKPVRRPGIVHAIRRWFVENRAQRGLGPVCWKFLSVCWEFVRDSTPSRRRQRYGDVEFDWEYRVDTTGATVSWRNRLMGLFHSPYQPTEPALFREMMASLDVDFCEFTFIDIGSGKGRVLLMAADYPFRRIIGVELFPELDRIAKENIARYKSDSQRCFAIESLCKDAREFEFPSGSLLIYLFNPLPEAGLREFLQRLGQSLTSSPRRAIVLYHNPQLESVIERASGLEKVGGTHQYSVFKNSVDRKTARDTRGTP